MIYKILTDFNFDAKHLNISKMTNLDYEINKLIY